MRHRFDGKVVMITGASAGIGAETARQLAREGAQVALLARRADKLDAVCAEIEAMRGTAAPFVADVCDRASLDTAVSGIIKKYGHLDIVLANAGFGVPGSLQSLDIDDYRRQFETNFFGLLNTIYAVLSHLEESRGQLGILGSVAGMIGTPAASPYNASKFAVVGLAEAIYHDLDELGIAVTLINPGFVESEFRLLDDQGKLTGKQDPVPSWLVLPVDKAARSIINALYRRKPEVIITFHGKALVICKRF
ncbi:MAG: SDR family NAD(P)-dependent oxidoreductase, partial [Candidatus Hydrogenedentes bacterium]|nr:SDR family NAD(P)-dependent oxidoreductase [Candidatus Hydrogenedentota bacterium]